MNNILPNLLVLITRYPRYKPEIIWSKKSIVHNLFRIYESIFWRRIGIRAEMRSYYDGNKVYYEIYTFEALLAYCESYFRNLLKFDSLKILNLSYSASPYGYKIPMVSFVIALDTANTGTTTTTSPLTWSHTSTGSNLLLAIGSGGSGASAPTTTAVTYNAVSATKAKANTGSGTVSGVSECSVWLLGTASSGANTISVSFTGGGNFVAGAVSYSGAQSGNAADATGGIQGTSAAAQSFSVTTVSDNCWVFSTGVIAGGTNPAFSVPIQTSRWSITLVGVNSQVGEDTNGPKTPAGAVSNGWTTGGTTSSSYRWAISGASFAPATATVTTSSSTLMMMGIG